MKEDENVVLRLDGFSLQDGSGIIRAAGIDCKEKVCSVMFSPIPWLIAASLVLRCAQYH